MLRWIFLRSYCRLIALCGMTAKIVVYTGVLENVPEESAYV